MRIAICGKGGSGKTTVAGTLARALAQRGVPLLAIDGDPNPTLATTLGIHGAETGDQPALPRDVVETVTAADGSRRLDLKLPIPTIIKDYGTTSPDGVTLIVAGRVEHAAKGCMCGTHAAMRTILRELLGQREGVTLVDMEAGIEHLSRATVSDVDIALVVVEPFYKSVMTAEKVVSLARELGIPRIAAVANKVRSDGDRSVIRAACQRWGIEVIAEVPFDESLRDSEQALRAPIDWGEGPAVTAVRGLAEQLVGAAV